MSRATRFFCLRMRGAMVYLEELSKSEPWFMGSIPCGTARPPAFPTTTNAFCQNVCTQVIPNFASQLFRQLRRG
jgi:hypothetical protein